MTSLRQLLNAEVDVSVKLRFIRDEIRRLESLQTPARLVRLHPDDYDQIRMTNIGRLWPSDWLSGSWRLFGVPIVVDPCINRVPRVEP